MEVKPVKKKLMLIPAIVLSVFLMFPSSPALAAVAVSGGTGLGDATSIVQSSTQLNISRSDTYFKFIPLETAQYTISSQSISDPYVYLLNGSGTFLTANDDYMSLDFMISYTLTANTVYYLRIGDFFGNSIITLNITGGAILGLPQITSQPDSCSAAVGDTASFSVSAASPADLAYQWQVSTDSGSTWASVADGTGAATASYTTPATTWAMDGYMYRCVVTNAAGSTTSDAATLTVTKAAPTITTAPSASALTYGDALSASVLTGGSASVSGTFAWTNSTIRPAVSDSGVTSYSVTFAPTDTTNYDIVTTTVTLTVNKATPTIATAPTAAALTYGDALSASALSGGSASVPGAFAWTNSAIKPAVSDSGVTSYSVTFTPTDSANYNTVTTAVTLSVSKATPTITTAPAAAALTYGDALSASALTGSASVPGAFAWTNSAIKPTVSDSGVTSYSVTFAPTDTTNYDIVTTTVTLTVNKAAYDMSGITFSNRSFWYTGAARSIFIAGTLPTGVSVSYSGNGWRDPGTYTVTASFSGDADNYQPIPDMTATLNIRSTASEPTPTPSPSPSPSASSSTAPAPSETPTPVSTPAASAPTPSPAPSASAQGTALIVVSADAESIDGTVFLTIDTGTLPEGTRSLQLPDGSIVDIDADAASVTVEISESDIGSDGTLLLIALSDEDIALASLSVATAEPAPFPGFLIWIIGIAVVAAVGVILFLTLKKKAR